MEKDACLRQEGEGSSLYDGEAGELCVWGEGMLPYLGCRDKAEPCKDYENIQGIKILQQPLKPLDQVAWVNWPLGGPCIESRPWAVSEHAT